MLLVINAAGSITCLYDEAIELAAMGSLSITRASQVEPDASGRWFTDLAMTGGPFLGPFAQRSQALMAEQAWLEASLTAEQRVQGETQ